MSSQLSTGWWLNQPIWKIWSFKMGIFPRGENQECLKPSPTVVNMKSLCKLGHEFLYHSSTLRLWPTTFPNVKLMKPELESPFQIPCVHGYKCPAAYSNFTILIGTDFVFLYFLKQMVFTNKTVDSPPIPWLRLIKKNAFTQKPLRVSTCTISQTVLSAGN